MTNIFAKVKGFSKKQLVILGVGVVAVLGGGVVAAMMLTESNRNVRGATAGINMLGASAYMEETVSLGDIVVGVSETGTASMYQEEISYDFSVTVESFYVKAGESVAQGQQLALLDMEAVNELKDALALSIADATVSLADAQANYDLKAIQAQKTLSQTLYNGENADANYAAALQDIQDRYTELQESVTELEVEWWTANDQVLYGLTDGYDVENLKEKRDAADEASKAADGAFSNAKEALEAAIKTYNADESIIAAVDINTLVTGLASMGAEKFATEYGAESKYSGNTKTLCELVQAYNKAESDQTAKNTAYTAAANAYSSAVNQYDTAYAKMEETLENAVKNLENAREAASEYEKNIPAYQIDAEADYQTALANYAAAYDVYDNTMAMNENTVENATQTLEQLQTEYQAYDVLPVDGIVLATCSGYVMRLADVDTEQKAGTALVTIGSDQSVEIWVSISQDDIADIGIGMETNVIFDAYEEYTIPAVVESISTSSSSGMTSSVNYTMEIICDISAYPELVVFDSMSATVTFVQRQESDVMMVSSKCITTQDGVSYVKMLDNQGDITMVAVETGFSDGFDVEIISGLSVGDVVIIESAVG